MAPASHKIKYPLGHGTVGLSLNAAISGTEALISILNELGKASELVEFLGLHSKSFSQIDNAGRERIWNRMVEGANKISSQFDTAAKRAATRKNKYGVSEAEAELFRRESRK